MTSSGHGVFELWRRWVAFRGEPAANELDWASLSANKVSPVLLALQVVANRRDLPKATHFAHRADLPIFWTVPVFRAD